jgi:ABC-type glutathione transport system ATPase component
MSAPLLEVRALAKRFPRPRRGLFRARPAPVHAVDDVDLDLARGEALGLVGQSGSGKSTVARLLVGLERASSGSIRLDGHELTALSFAQWRPHRRTIQLVFQDPGSSLDPRQTAGAIVAEPLAIHRLGKPRERAQRAAALLESVGLPASAAVLHPHEFSGGQRQRIAIARALALEPHLLVCDEPTSALDVSVQAQVLNLLHELQQRLGLALLLISHDLAVVRALCARVAVMERGKIVECATREELFARPQHAVTKAMLASAPRLR